MYFCHWCWREQARQKRIIRSKILLCRREPKCRPQKSACIWMNQWTSFLTMCCCLYCRHWMTPLCVAFLHCAKDCIILWKGDRKYVLHAHSQAPTVPHTAPHTHAIKSSTTHAHTCTRKLLISTRSGMTRCGSHTCCLAIRFFKTTMKCCESRESTTVAESGGYVS